jgi:dTDP-4-amino-4,6-dideoxygalactose transaminase
VAERLADEVVSLPVWPGMREAEVERVWKAVRSIFVGK